MSDQISLDVYMQHYKFLCSSYYFATLVNIHTYTHFISLQEQLSQLRYRHVTYRSNLTAHYDKSTVYTCYHHRDTPLQYPEHSSL